MNYLIVLIVLTFVLPFSAVAETPEEKGLAIAVEADRRDTGFIDTSSDFMMTLMNRHGQQSTREMRSKVLEVKGDGDKSLIIFDHPRDVKGTAMLTFTHKHGNDDQWLYLPALKRVKRISSSNKSGSFMGSEFSYEDLASQEVEKYTYRWLRDEGCPGAVYSGLECFVVERYPVDKESGYTRQVVWSDTLEYRVIKVDYYDRKGSLLKTLTFLKYEQYLDRFWRSLEMFMLNHQTGKSTRLIWSNLRFWTGLKDSDFTRSSLKRAR
jgi:hypothetical protein